MILLFGQILVKPVYSRFRYVGIFNAQHSAYATARTSVKLYKINILYSLVLDLFEYIYNIFNTVGSKIGICQ